uniref:hypothetical protein n=1 Tax=uncultured Ruegeria sp. TaxID=259304 RepID=UPI00262D0B4C
MSVLSRLMMTTASVIALSGVPAVAVLSFVTPGAVYAQDGGGDNESGGDNEGGGGSEGGGDSE